MLTVPRELCITTLYYISNAITKQRNFQDLAMSVFNKKTLEKINASTPKPNEEYVVMLVDDKESNIAVMAAILRPYFNLLEANDGREAIRLVEEMERPETLACIVSDHRMPKMTGVELFEQIVSKLPHTNRILVTGYLDIDAIIDAINKGRVNKFIAKPFEASDFLLTVRIAVASFEGRRRLEEYYVELERMQKGPSEKAQAILAKIEEANEEIAMLDAELKDIRLKSLGEATSLRQP